MTVVSGGGCRRLFDGRRGVAGSDCGGGALDGRPARRQLHGVAGSDRSGGEGIKNAPRTIANPKGNQ